MNTHQPWQRSTGPKSPLGKLSSRYSKSNGIFRRFVKSWEVEDFDYACREAEAAIATLEADHRAYPDQYRQFKVKRLQGATTNGDYWMLFVVQAVYYGQTDQLLPRLELAEQIRQQYGSQGKPKWKTVKPLYADDPWLQAILRKAAQQRSSSILAPIHLD